MLLRVAPLILVGSEYATTFLNWAGMMARLSQSAWIIPHTQSVPIVVDERVANRHAGALAGNGGLDSTQTTPAHMGSFAPQVFGALRR